MTGDGTTLRRATAADLETIYPRTRALNEHEGIHLTEEGLRGSLGELLDNPALGGVWLVCQAGATVGYAIVTYCFDLEFGGREGWLTELYVDEAARGRGAGAQVAPSPATMSARSHSFIAPSVSSFHTPARTSIGAASEPRLARTLDTKSSRRFEPRVGSQLSTFFLGSEPSCRT